MQVVILAGGYGTRLSEETEIRPKPMVEIGGKPIIWHIMKHYAHYGYTEFFLALGYKGEMIKQYFHEYLRLSGNMTIDMASGNVTRSSTSRSDWKINLIDTGLDSNTGGRVHHLKKYLDAEPFMLTYGDGVCNVNLNQLEEFHQQNGKSATLTAVRPPARFGGLVLDGNSVSTFTEKPQIGEGWINGGFMVLENEVFNLLNSKEDVLEIDVLEKLADKGELSAFKHPGFWQCMDTLRDKRLLEKHWKEDSAPWKVWK